MLQKKQKNNTFLHAFTLIEMLVILCIIGILLIAAYPMWRNTVVKNRSFSEARKVFNALQFARGEAIKLGKAVKFCKSKDLTQCCDKECSWSDGQLVVVSYGSKNDVLLVSAPSVFGDELRWEGSLGHNEFLQFSPDGATAGQQGAFYYCPAHAKEYALAVIVQQTGRIRISSKKANGGAIICN